MTYTRMDVEPFGRALIESGDLDPVYIALDGCEWDSERLQRWLMAYWLFYHPGAACYMSDAETEKLFWNRVHNAAKNETPSPLDERWPRASERRHFRGEKAVAAVQALRNWGGSGLRNMFIQLTAAAPDYDAVARVVTSWPMFGPWMAFKVADMLDCCTDIPVTFDLGSVTMFDDPKKAALMVWKVKSGFDPKAEAIRPKDPDQAVREVVEYLIHEYRDLSAPPRRGRPVGYQEVETVLCKWKSHLNGHYPVGKDTREIREGLLAWAEVSEAAREFLHHMPAESSVSGDSEEGVKGDKVPA